MLVIGPDPVVDGCKIWLDTSEYSSGTTWSDISGNGNDFSFSYGAVPSHTAGTSGFFTFAGANNERAIFDNFDTDIIGSGSRVDAAAIECWVQGNSVDNAMLWDAGTGSTRDQWGMRYSWIGNDDWNNFMSGLNGTNLISNNDVADTNWHQIVSQVDLNILPGTTNRREFYLDGQLNANIAASAYTNGAWDSTNISRFVIGAQAIGGSPFNGKVGIWRMYDRGLTASEVLRNFNSAKARFGI